MTDPFPDASDSAQGARARLFREIYFGRLWSRTLPEGAINIFTALFAGPATRAEIHERSRAGLEGPIWDDLKIYTDDELDGSETAEEVNTEESAERDRRIAQLNTYGQAHGLRPIDTVGRLLDLMTACRILTLDDDGRYDLNPGAPLPGKVLPLPSAEAELQDKMRWAELHESTAQDLIRLFQPDAEDPVSDLTTSLQRLACQLKIDPERVRAGLQTLLEEGDFSASIDVATAREHQVFKISVDWDQFHEDRISLTVKQPPTTQC